ncbi:hypothetical protein NJ959_28575 [Symplocastrum sp. BBK-W-15]|uniref:Uncharacterized protein n=1 Tax=Limnofasciculus baicalensis BBK-W-15 TaxID=2699891 RepID=A0AAE3KR04_9CYAN|nr:hypothetical protein [Limnofasciculus baicalensis BBK-W-15]
MGRTDQKMTISTILTATQVAAAFRTVSKSQGFPSRFLMIPDPVVRGKY